MLRNGLRKPMSAAEGVQMSDIEHLIENYIHAMAKGKKPDEIAELYKDQLEDTGMSPVTMWEIAQHVVYGLYDGFFPDFPDLPLTVKQVGMELREVVFCKDCERQNHDDWNYPQDEVCPLVSYRGKAQAHEFDYQYCVYERRKENDDIDA